MGIVKNNSFELKNSYTGRGNCYIVVAFSCWGEVMKDIEYCMRYDTCRRCPRNRRCNEEIERAKNMSEYITCSRCGIVKRGHICPRKTYRKRDKDSKADKFRKSKAWTNKSIEIRQRDRYLCRVCEANLYNTIRQFNFDKLEVHHIIPIAEDYNKRLDNDNLITLCNYHHKLAEENYIPREELQNLIPALP